MKREKTESERIVMDIMREHRIRQTGVEPTEDELWDMYSSAKICLKEDEPIVVRRTPEAPPSRKKPIPLVQYLLKAVAVVFFVVLIGSVIGLK